MRNQIYPPFYPDIKISSANGIYLYDDEQKRKIIDLSGSAGMALIGYNHEKMRKTIHRQTDKIIIAPQKYKTEEAEILIKKILALFPKEYDTVMPAVTGSEAVEIAMQTAIIYTGKNVFLSFDNAYHGHTVAARSLGETDKKLGLLGDKFKTVKPPKNAKDINRALEQTGAELKSKKIAAFICEGVITNAGFMELPSGFMRKLLELCHKYGALLICDEVLTGFGRTGKIFSFEHHGVKPDMVCLAKGMASGYAAIAAVITKRELLSGYDYFSTFAWSPLSCAIAAANIDIIKEENLVQNSADMGKYARFILKRKLGNCPLVEDVRGVGLGISLRFKTRDDAIRIHNKCLENGVVLFRNINLNMLFITPPLVITKEELEKALQIVIKVIIGDVGRK